MIWRIGCSGFHYKEWKGLFYPEKLPQRLWFDYYCKHFNTLELNVTFYRFPQLAALQNWYQQSPEGFEFAVKVPRLITHYKQFNDTARMLADFYGTVRDGLKEKAGPILFQLPARMTYSKELLHRILDSLDESFLNVVEFRHSSWWSVEVYTQAAQHKAIFAGSSFPGLPPDVITGQPVIYYRFHGIPKLYYSEYDKATLEQAAKAIVADEAVNKAYVYFNNTATLAALHNAVFLQQFVQKITVQKI